MKDPKSSDAESDSKSIAEITGIRAQQQEKEEHQQPETQKEEPKEPIKNENPSTPDKD
jgi:hypothetical protein